MATNLWEHEHLQPFTRKPSGLGTPARLPETLYTEGGGRWEVRFLQVACGMWFCRNVWSKHQIPTTLNEVSISYSRDAQHTAHAGALTQSGSLINELVARQTRSPTILFTLCHDDNFAFCLTRPLRPSPEPRPCAVLSAPLPSNERSRGV